MIFVNNDKFDFSEKDDKWLKERYDKLFQECKKEGMSMDLKLVGELNAVRQEQIRRQ